MLVVIDPATNDWVQLPDQVCLSGTIVALDNTSAFRKKRLGIFLGRFDEQFAPHHVSTVLLLGCPGKRATKNSQLLPPTTRHITHFSEQAE